MARALFLVALALWADKNNPMGRPLKLRGNGAGPLFPRGQIWEWTFFSYIFLIGNITWLIFFISRYIPPDIQELNEF